MRHLLRLAYDGTGFAGCSELPDQRTVCGELRRALLRVNAGPGLVETLSRTDAGVHAVANVAHVALERPLEDTELLGVLDRHLPEDLRCTAVARVDAPPAQGSKVYRYTLDTSPHGDPLRARFCWRPPGAVDVEVLRALASVLPGTRDWVAFRRTGETREDLVRTIASAGWTEGDGVLHFTVSGSGFPYRLVRALVGGMVMVARGGATRQAWDRALEGHPDSPAARQTAPARGLLLVESLPGVDWVS